MRKNFIFLLIFIMLSRVLNAQSSFFTPHLTEGSIRFLVPELDPSEVGVFLNLGIGYHHTIVPGWFSPGIYFDAGIGADWFYLLSLFSGDYENSNYDKNRELNHFGLNLGFRLYNFMEIGFQFINFKPFVGYNVIIGLADKRMPSTIHNPVAGASLIFNFANNSIGFEYCFYFPVNGSHNIRLHHFSIVIQSINLERRSSGPRLQYE